MAAIDAAYIAWLSPCPHGRSAAKFEQVGGPMRSLCKITIVALAVCCCVPAQARTSGYKDWAELEGDLVDKKMLHRPIPMRDGVKLDANIYLPRGKGPFPVVLYRS